MYPKGDTAKNHPPPSELRLDVQVDRWVKRLYEFLSEYGKQPLARPGGNFRPAIELEHWDDTGCARSFPSPWPSTITLVIRTNALSPEMFQRFIRWSNEGRRLHRSRQFLYRAKQALFEGDYTVTIVNAATGIEIAVLEYLERTLPRFMTAPGVKNTLKTYRTIGRRAQLCSDVGLKMPPKLIPDLVNPRNDILHKGHHADHDMARKALTAARDAVAVLNPPFFEPA